MSDPANLDANLTVFERFCPSFVEEVRTACVEDFEFCASKSGQLNLKKRLAEGAFYYHSKEDPVLEATLWFEDLSSIGKAEGLIIFGIGLGYCYDAAKSWLKENPERVLVFIEPDFSALRLFFSTDRSREIVENPQVVVLGMKVGTLEAESATYKYFQVASLLLYSSLTLFSELKSYGALFTGLWKTAKKMIQLQMREKRFESNFFRQTDMKTRISNNLMNVAMAAQSKLFYGLQDCLKGIPAIICGAGPSLADDLANVEKYFDSALVVGAGSGMNVLNQHHIFPLLGIGVDPNDTSRSRILTNTSYMTPFCYQLGFNHRALHILHGPKLYLRGIDHYGMDAWFEKQFGIDHYPSIVASVSSTEMCFKIAQLLGCSPIVLLGVDLSYTDNKRYPKGIFVHPIDPEVEKEQISDIQTTELVPAKGIGGKTVLTRMDWIKEGRDFAQFAQEFPDIKVINATSKGLEIGGIEHLSLNEVGESYFGMSFDLDNLLHAEIQNCRDVAQDRDRVREVMAAWNESLDRCYDLFLQLLEQLASLTKNYEKDPEFAVDFESEGYNELLGKITKEDAFKHFLGSMLSEYQTIFFREAFPLIYRKELFSERERSIKRLRYMVKQYTFLVHVLLMVKDIVVKALEKGEWVWQPSSASSGPHQTKDENLGGIYSFEDGRFVIQDEEADLLWEEEFSPNRLERGAGHETRGIFHFLTGSNGLPDGQCLIYYPDGELKGECFYKEGKLHGPSIFYTKEGGVLAKGWFIENKRAGKNFQYYPSNKLYSVKRFRDGKAHGLHEYFYESGVTQAKINYCDGRLDGDVQLFFPDGSVRRELRFQKGKLHGKERMRWENGHMMLEAEFSEGVPVGVSRSWYESGQIKREVRFYGSPEHQDLTVWNKSGKVQKEKKYIPSAISDDLIKKSNEASDQIKKIQEKLARIRNKEQKQQSYDD